MAELSADNQAQQGGDGPGDKGITAVASIAVVERPRYLVYLPLVFKNAP